MAEKKDVEIKFPAFLPCPVGPRVFNVVGNLDTKASFVNGRGYVYDGMVWIYSKEKPKDSKYPYFWFDKGPNILFGKVRDEVKDIFDVKNLKDWSYINMVKETTPGDKLYDEEMITKMNSSTKIYKPTIKDEDDILKKLIKTIILTKEVNVKKYSSQFDKPYVLPNLITGLDGKTKTSINVWELWASMLGVRFDIIIRDIGDDKESPLPTTIHYSNVTDKITQIPESDDLDKNLYDILKVIDHYSE